MTVSQSAQNPHWATCSPGAKFDPLVMDMALTAVRITGVIGWQQPGEDWVSDEPGSNFVGVDQKTALRNPGRQGRCPAR